MHWRAGKRISSLATIGKERRVNVGISFLLFSGSIVGLNWLNLSSLFPFVANDLHFDVSALGAITAVYVIGAGAFQIPGALVAGKYSQKKIIILGTLGASISTLLVSFASSVVEFEILRFACAVSTAFAYAPGYSLITKYFSAGKEGSAIGLFGGAAICGNIVALAADSVLPVYMGWRDHPCTQRNYRSNRRAIFDHSSTRCTIHRNGECSLERILRFFLESRK